MNIDLTPFLAEALSYNGNLKNEIDNLYRTKNEEFYSYALKSPYYNCILAQERFLIEEEYWHSLLYGRKCRYKNSRIYF